MFLRAQEEDCSLSFQYVLNDGDPHNSIWCAPATPPPGQIDFMSAASKVESVLLTPAVVSPCVSPRPQKRTPAGCDVACPDAGPVMCASRFPTGSGMGVFRCRSL